MTLGSFRSYHCSGVAGIVEVGSSISFRLALAAPVTRYGL